MPVQQNQEGEEETYEENDYLHCKHTDLYAGREHHPAQAQEQSKGATVDIRDERRNSRLQLTHLLAQVRPHGRAGFSLMPANNNSAAPPFASASIIPAANLQVLGNGSLGRLTNWTGFTSNNSTIGDSNIYEDKRCNASSSSALKLKPGSGSSNNDDRFAISSPRSS